MFLYWGGMIHSICCQITTERSVISPSWYWLRWAKTQYCSLNVICFGQRVILIVLAHPILIRNKNRMTVEVTCTVTRVTTGYYLCVKFEFALRLKYGKLTTLHSKSIKQFDRFHFFGKQCDLNYELFFFLDLSQIRKVKINQ